MGRRQYLGYSFDYCDLVQYSIWILERECYEILTTVVFICAFTSSIYCVPSYTIGPWMGIDDVSYVSKCIFYRAMVGCQVASVLEKIDECKQLPYM